MVACGGEPADAPDRPLPDQTLVELPVQSVPPDLTEAVLATQAAILETTDRDSLRRFARLADSHSGFASNFEQSDHFAHWSLLRQTGVDPLREIERLFEGQHSLRSVGSEVWYVWPDFAARAPEDLLPERLSFQDRARLLDLVGEGGIERIRAGSAYPGVRTAISETGRWVYYLHGIGEDTVSADE